MSHRSNHRVSGKLAAALAGAAATAGSIAGVVLVSSLSSADAGILVDLRAVTINGVPVELVGGSAKQVAPAGPGDVIGIDIYAVVSGTNALNDEALQDLSGSFRSTGGDIHGDLALQLLAPFNANGSSIGSRLDVDSDGDLDVGPEPTNGTPGISLQYPYFRSNTMTQDGTPVSSGSEEFRIATLTFTTGAGSGAPTYVEFLLRKNPNGTNNLTYGVWREDDSPRNAQNSPITASGVLIGIPEPTALALGGFAALGLLARRRDRS